MLRTLRGLDPTARSSPTSSEAEVADEPVDATSEAPEITRLSDAHRRHRRAHRRRTDRVGRHRHHAVHARRRHRVADDHGVAVDRGVRRELPDAGVDLHRLRDRRNRSTTRSPSSPRSTASAPMPGSRTTATRVYTGRYQTFTDCSDSGTVVRHGRRGASRQLVHRRRRDAARVRRRSRGARPGVRDVHRDALNRRGMT